MTDQRAIFNISVTPIMQHPVFSRYIVQNSQARSCGSRCDEANSPDEDKLYLKVG